MENKNQLLNFYHIGKIVKVITGKTTDRTAKAVIEMWDSNVITCCLGKAKPKDGDFVVVRFDGITQSNGLLMHPAEITDIMSQADGETIWSTYKHFFEKAKPSHPLTG